jgi:hypothetical protein
LGLVDLSALEGERVQCRYNPDAEGDWEIIVPEDESISGRLRAAVAGFWAASRERDWTLTGAFYYLLCPPLFLFVTMLDGFLTGSTPSYDEWGGYALSTVFVSVVWLFVVGLLLLTL